MLIHGDTSILLPFNQDSIDRSLVRLDKWRHLTKYSSNSSKGLLQTTLSHYLLKLFLFDTDSYLTEKTILVLFSLKFGPKSSPSRAGWSLQPRSECYDWRVRRARVEPIKSQLNSCLLQLHLIYILLTNYTSLILSIQFLHQDMNLKGRCCSNNELVHNSFWVVNGKRERRPYYGPSCTRAQRTKAAKTQVFKRCTTCKTWTKSVTVCRVWGWVRLASAAYPLLLLATGTSHYPITLTHGISRHSIVHPSF